MKKIPFWVIPMTAVLGSCSNETIYETNNGSNTSGRVPITFSAYTPAMTRADAAVATIDSLTETGGGFYLQASYDTEAAGGNGTTATQIFAETYFCNADDGSCYNEEHKSAYWPSDKDAAVSFIGIYPHTLIDEETTTLSRNDNSQYELAFAADGKKDYMAAYTSSSLSATENGAGSIELTFKHLLAQVQFYIKCEDDGLAYTLKSAKLNAPKKATYNLVTGSVVADEEMQDYTFASSASEIASANYAKKGDTYMLPATCNEVEGVASGSTCTLTITYEVQYTETSSLSYTKSAEVVIFAGYVNNINASVSGGDTPISISVSVDQLKNYHAYVDLGLPSGLLWATCNIGADSPEDYGNYFAWGETTGYDEGKTTFSWENYTLCEGSSRTMTKYCTDSNYGAVDNKTVLEFDDDAAAANWGGIWRIPTAEEWQELLDNCTQEYGKQNNVNGFIFTSSSNGESLFLPACGDRMSVLDREGNASYWSSSLYTGNNEARYATGDSYNQMKIQYSSYERCRGLPIRPVRNPD